MTHPARVPGVGVDPEVAGPACLLARPCPRAGSTHSRSARDVLKVTLAAAHERGGEEPARGRDAMLGGARGTSAAGDI